MGRWYLMQLEIAGEPLPDSPVSAVGADGEGKRAKSSHAAKPETLVIYINPQMEQLRQLVAGARARLAGLEADYTRERSRVDTLRAALFRQLKDYYQKRDRFRLVIDYRRRFLDTLLRSGEDEAQQSAQGYKEARARIEQEYEETSASVSEKKSLTAEEEKELTGLWKKLVKLYHPDRFAGEPDKLETYTKLTGAINRAKDTGDMKTLREIAEDPAGYILRQGWASLDFSDEVMVTQLRRLYDTLQIEIVRVIEALGELRSSSDYELSSLCARNPGMLADIAKQQESILEKECRDLEQQAAKLAEEIEQLSGDRAPPIA
jgi:DNA polymerase-3 subunit epsilon